MHPSMFNSLLNSPPTKHVALFEQVGFQSTRRLSTVGVG